MTYNTGYNIKKSILPDDASLTEYGRECLAQCVARRYKMPFHRVWKKMRYMTTVQRDQYLDKLKESMDG